MLKYKEKHDQTRLLNNSGLKIKLLLKLNRILIMDTRVTILEHKEILLLVHQVLEDITLYRCRMIHVLLVTETSVTDLTHKVDRFLMINLKLKVLNILLLRVRTRDRSKINLIKADLSKVELSNKT